MYFTFFLILDCENGTFGKNCSSLCSGNCIDNITCNSTNGYCYGFCAAGFLGEYCNIRTYMYIDIFSELDKLSNKICN